MEKYNDWIEHFYSREQLQRYLNKFNDIFEYLKVTWNFDLNDEIVDVKRGIVNENDSIYRDYLDFVHKPVKLALFDNKINRDKDFAFWLLTKWIHCIKFILKSGKELIIAETENKDLPKWVHGWGEYASQLKNIKKMNSDKSYYDMVLSILSEIGVDEHDYFHSPEYLNHLKTVDIAQALTITDGSDGK